MSPSGVRITAVTGWALTVGTGVVIEGVGGVGGAVVAVVGIGTTELELGEMSAIEWGFDPNTMSLRMNRSSEVNGRFTHTVSLVAHSVHKNS